MKKLLPIFFGLLITTNAWAVNYCDDANVVLCAPMDASESPVDDKSANSNTGTHNGTPTFATADPPDTGDGTSSNYQTGYWELNDDDVDFFNFGADSSLNVTGNNFTIVLWGYSNFTTWEYPINKKNGSDGGFQLGVENGNDLESQYYTTGSDFNYNPASSDWADNEWEHIAYVIRSGEMCVYQNATEYCDGGSTATIDTHSTTDLLVGKRLARVCQFAMFSRALSSSEITDIMQNGLGYVESSGRSRRFVQ